MMIAELTSHEISDFLKKNHIGRIGCNDGKLTYVVPITYIFCDDCVLCHSRGGLKIEMMRKNPAVCLEVDDITDYRHWKSIIIQGEYKELSDPKELANAQRRFRDETLSIKFSISAMPPSSVPNGNRVEKPASTELVFFKIQIHNVTGRYEVS